MTLQTITEKTWIPLSLAATAIVGVIGLAVYATTLKDSVAAVKVEQERVNTERRDNRNEFLSTLKALQETSIRTQLDIVEIKGDVKALRRR